MNANTYRSDPWKVISNKRNDWAILPPSQVPTFSTSELLITYLLTQTHHHFNSMMDWNQWQNIVDSTHPHAKSCGIPYFHIHNILKHHFPDTRLKPHDIRIYKANIVKGLKDLDSKYAGLTFPFYRPRQIHSNYIPSIPQ